jgi:uncharacterized protein YxjI
MFDKNKLIVKQTHEIVEIVVNFETANRYIIMDETGNLLGRIIEKGGGLWNIIKRNFFRSHRPFEVHIYDNENTELLVLKRSFYFFFSDLYIYKKNRKIGHVRRRFKLFGTKYDFNNGEGRTFASIHAGIFRIWKFPIVNKMGASAGHIVKKWRGFDLGGILTEAFTDADTFLIDYGQENWSQEQKEIILSAAVAVDFDHFENNQNGNDITNDF